MIHIEPRFCRSSAYKRDTRRGAMRLGQRKVPECSGDKTKGSGQLEEERTHTVVEQMQLQHVVAWSSRLRVSDGTGSSQASRKTSCTVRGN